MCLLCFQNFSFLQIMENTLKLFIFGSLLSHDFYWISCVDNSDQATFLNMVCISYWPMCHIWSPDYFKVPSLTVSLFMASCQRRKVFFQLKIGRTLRLPDFLLEMYSHTHLPYSFWSYQSFRNSIETEEKQWYIPQQETGVYY